MQWNTVSSLLVVRTQAMNAVRNARMHRIWAMDVWYFAVTLCVRNQRKRKINLQNIKKLLPSGFVRVPGTAAFLY